MKTILENLKAYFANTPREQIEKDWDALKEYDDIGPTVGDFLNSHPINDTMKVKIKLSDKAKMPTYATEGSSGCDLYATETITIPPGRRTLIPTGVSIELPIGMEAQIRPRSGNALKRGLTVLNSPGTIDSDFRGEIGVIIYNTNSVPERIVEGDKIAQMVIAPYLVADFVKVDELSETERGNGGFGSTDKKEFGAGYKVMITGNKANHYYNIGEIVSLLKLEPSGLWRCHSDKHGVWWISESDGYVI